MRDVWRLAKLIDCSPADVFALKALCRAGHTPDRPRGMTCGLCVCGHPGDGPTPPACIALRRLVDIAESVEVRS